MIVPGHICRQLEPMIIPRLTKEYIRCVRLKITMIFIISLFGSQSKSSYYLTNYPITMFSVLLPKFSPKPPTFVLIFPCLSGELPSLTRAYNKVSKCSLYFFVPHIFTLLLMIRSLRATNAFFITVLIFQLRFAQFFS